MNQLVKTTDLLTVDPAHFVEVSYQPFTEALEAAIAKAPSLTYEISTKSGMEVAKEGRALFRNIRTSLEKKRAAAKAPIIEIGRLLDARAKEIVQRIEPFEAQFDGDIKAEEQRIEAEKAAKAQAEAERQARIQTRIDNIKNAPLKAINASSASIHVLIDSFTTCNLDDEGLDERLDEAKYVLKETLTQLQSMLDGKLAQEQLTAQQEAARLESERVARELAAQRLAEEKAQREAMAAQAAELARQKAEMDQRARELAEAEAKVKAAQEAILSAERAKMEAELKAKAEAEQEAVAKQNREYLTNLAKTAIKNGGFPSAEENEAAAIEARRKAAQIASQLRPVYVEPQDMLRPSRAEIIALVSSHFGLSEAESIVLLMAEFGYQEEAA